MKRDRQTIATLFAFNDFLWTLLAGFMVITVMLIATYQVKKEQQDSGKDVPAGAASIYCFWPDGMPTDVDLHVLDPTGAHIFFNVPQSQNVNLLRDDLGMNGDTTPKNFENVYIRELVPGDYTINLHAFSGAYPAVVDCEINFLAGGAGTTRNVRFIYKLVLAQKGDELTVFRFVIGADGKLVTGSMNHLQKDFAQER